MIVRPEDGASVPYPYFYAACLDCGWCSLPRATELAAGEADDAHLAAKLAARRPTA